MEMQALETPAQDITPALELGMQELEAMEAPGWWSVTGYISGAAVGSAVTYSVVATVIT